MSADDLPIFGFLLASCGCLVAGLGVWALTALLRRHLPDSCQQRSIWLLGQITVLATFLVILLPALRQQLRLRQSGWVGDPGKNNGLVLSWIGSSLKISPVEQVAFLRKLVNRQLALSAQAYDMTSRIMISETLENGWEVHGKTGTAPAVLPD